MSDASDMKDLASQARDIYQVMGNSGVTYLFFWFPDGSVCAGRYLPSSNNMATARMEFTNAKEALRDCGVSEEGTPARLHDGVRAAEPYPRVVSDGQVFTGAVRVYMPYVRCQDEVQHLLRQNDHLE